MKSIIKIVGDDYVISSLPKSYQKIRPLKNRDTIPAIRINCELGVWQHLPSGLQAASSMYLHQLVQDGPLVISTYSPDWNEYGERHIQLLNSVYPRIRALGGNLLLLTTEYFKNIVHTIQEYDLEFNILQDYENRISESLGVYSKYEPVWDRIAGISEDVPFAATFVVNADRRIVYDYVDRDFEFIVSDKEIEKAVKIAQ
ncbi:redoxin domain-containing protein [Runella slithyformis]|uniref:Alkyl hydroperoxide reductase/thiol specific antioxidant/Mal allergen n=1 Tax=Runella slithyformis (strain ATCC 29530 / DSM 19594 / LMG 11500 / NCIMB 11436 / LSU 4) TaxID=761193 RepID=A0A7U3ZQT9_RUNSL|nr:redoxin domain-containing protein [Runella slithyformis]AEI51681.1 alkyl hydroperoxide reductase/thiol specific antioxidant/Mal allergen [Runella slithyformis DSM 19594]